PGVLGWRVSGLAALAGVWWLFRHRGGYGTVLGHPFALTDLVFDPAAGLAFFLLLCGCLAAERRSQAGSRRLPARRLPETRWRAPPPPRPRARRGGGRPGPAGGPACPLCAVHAPRGGP